MRFLQQSFYRVFLSFLLMCKLFTVSAQHNFSFTHYTSDDGLSQNTITAMMKDSKGYLWLGTREGLNKFDGYNFTVFNSHKPHFSSLLTNRIRSIKEDQWGYIWLRTYDDILYRLDVNTESLTRIPNEEKGFILDKIKETYFLASGDIWLSTFNQGAYRVRTDLPSGKMHVKHYRKEKGRLSGNEVHHVFQDLNQHIWLLTDAGLTQIKDNEERESYFQDRSFFISEETARHILFASQGCIVQYDKQSKSFQEIGLQEDSRIEISDIKALSPHQFLVATKGEGFYSINTNKSPEIKNFSKARYPQLPTDQIMSIYIDRNSEAWMNIKDRGIIHFEPRSERLEYLLTVLNEGQVTNPNYFIFEDQNNRLWVQPYFGSFSWYNRESGQLLPFRSSRNNDVNSLFDYGLNHILADPSGVFWLSSNRGNGFYKCTFLPDYFEHYLFDKQFVYNIANETRSIFEDRQNRLWVACKDGKVHVFDKDRNELGVLSSSGWITTSDTDNLNILVYNIFQDSKGHIWLATKRNGIFRLSASGNNQFSIENYTHRPADPFSPANNDFYSITEDKKGRLWAGSYGAGLHLITEEQGRVRFIHSKNGLHTYPMENYYRIRQIYPDSKGNIWVATTEGLVVFRDDFTRPEDIVFTQIQKDEKKHNLGANDIHCIYEDKQNRLWIGSFGGGLSKLINNDISSGNIQFETYYQQNGMPNNIVYTILEDKQGYLWLTTENSIVKFHPQTAEIEIFGKDNELENVEFSEASAAVLHTGEICVGTKSGFHSFQPEKVHIQPLQAPMVLTRLKLSNQEVEIGARNSPLQRHIDQTERLVLNHKQNVFTIEYATLDMRAPQNIQYAYRLKGFDADWNYVKNKRDATYTALPPGNYTFQVFSTDSEGLWLQNERSIDIKILPSFWQSVWAKILYVVLFILVFLTTLYILLTIYKLKSNVQMEQQMTNLKLRFFTDISHELRTPLTLISLPLDNMLNQQELKPEEVKEQLNYIRRNLDRVMRLINQILDFRKVQNKKMRLKVEETDFGTFVVACSESFYKIASDKNIDLQIKDETKKEKVWLDKDQFDSIISNLLSNAFKFTPAGKKITVRAFIENEMAVLEVDDQGVGIEQDKINVIFDRFFSAQSIRNITQKSTGIGLNLVKELVELHHGSIDVESEIGQGSLFRIKLPLGVAHFKDDADIILSDQTVPLTRDEELLFEAPEEPVFAEEEKKNLPLILLVEDNEELRFFLAKGLKKEYRVEEAPNGIIGWEKAQELIPDFIISDLLMPEMDGMELTHKLKNDENTSHIPVILLTAVTDMESKLSGMKAGADDYITKPFSIAFLMARIENLIRQRNKLQDFYRSRLFSPSLPVFEKPEEAPSSDELFLNKLMQLMVENIENHDLNIDFLASELTMSRTVFFNKLKSLTGFSPIEFVRETRLQRAAEYISNTNLSFSEIAYKVGFEDPRYFSRCFKQKFGKTPSEYRSN